MRRAFAIFICAFFSFSTAARADIAVFGATVFSETGVANSGDALGADDGVSAIIGDGGVLVIEFDQWLSAELVTVTTLANGFIASAAVSIGHVVGGVAVFSAAQTFTNIAGGSVQNFDFSAQCATISANGCSLVRIETTGVFFSSGIAVDGVTSAAPEPAFWMLSILAFALVGWRLKTTRRAGLLTIEAPGAPAAFAAA